MKGKWLYYLVLVIVLAGTGILCIANNPVEESFYSIVLFTALLEFFIPAMACVSGIYLGVKYPVISLLIKKTMITAPLYILFGMVVIYAISGRGVRYFLWCLYAGIAMAAEEVLLQLIIAFLSRTISLKLRKPNGKEEL